MDCITLTRVGKTVTIYINTFTEGYDLNYLEADKIINELRNIKKIKILEIFINSHGGDINTYLYFAGNLVRLAEKNNFEIKTYAEPNVFSAAILIWLCADKHNRHINNIIGQLVFHPIDFDINDPILNAIGTYTRNRVYDFVCIRTGLGINIVKNMYDNDEGYLHINNKNAQYWNLI